SVKGWRGASTETAGIGRRRSASRRSENASFVSALKYSAPESLTVAEEPPERLGACVALRALKAANPSFERQQSSNWRPPCSGCEAIQRAGLPFNIRWIRHVRTLRGPVSTNVRNPAA